MCARNRNLRGRVGVGITLMASLASTSCALLQQREPDADRWPAAVIGTWETESSGGGYDYELWTLGEGGQLRVESVEESEGDAARRVYSWNGSWWTKPAGDSGTARELCYVRLHGRNAWCEEYDLSTDPASGATTLIRLEDRTLRAP